MDKNLITLDFSALNGQLNNLTKGVRELNTKNEVNEKQMKKYNAEIDTCKSMLD